MVRLQEYKDELGKGVLPRNQEYILKNPELLEHPVNEIIEEKKDFVY